MTIITHGRDGVAIIGIDCAPMTPRPDTYIEEVVAPLGITEIPSPVSKSFGAWIWEFEGVSIDKWNESKEEIVSICERLYYDGDIRGAQHYWNSAIQYYLRSKVDFDTYFLGQLTVDDLINLIEENDLKEKFREDFEYAKSFVDEVFKQAKLLGKLKPGHKTNISSFGD